MQHAYLTAGIVPIDTVYSDVNKILEKLTPEEQRAARRKFRKLWRKVARERAKKHSLYVRKTVGLGTPVPTKAMKKTRKYEVMTYFSSKIVKSMITNSEENI